MSAVFGRILTTSLDHLELHARTAPDRIALVDVNGRVSYHRFHADAVRFAHLLAGFGIRQGHRVLVSHSDFYVHWLVIVACEALGAVSASFSGEESATGDSLNALLGHADFVLVERMLPSRAAEGQHVLSAEWLRQAFAMPEAAARDHPRSRITRRAPVRITRSSGTTGRAKLILIRRRVQDWWIEHVTAREGLTPRSRFLTVNSFIINAVLCRATACLRLGATVVFGPAIPVLSRVDITHLWLMPVQLAGLVRAAPEDLPKQPGLRIVTGGAPVFPGLRNETRRILGAEIEAGYGANEVGTHICTVDAEGIATPAPGVAARIVDPAGRSVPERASGAVLLRTPGLVEGYIGDDRATERAFRNGWFVSGDLGTRLSGGRFRILGRRDDVVNLGGVKIAPLGIERAILKASPLIREAAVTAVPNAEGIGELLVAVVLEPGGDPRQVADTLGPVLPEWLGRAWLLPCRRLPATANGKVRRADLRSLVPSSPDPRSETPGLITLTCTMRPVRSSA